MVHFALSTNFRAFVYRPKKLKAGVLAPFQPLGGKICIFKRKTAIPRNVGNSMAYFPGIVAPFFSEFEFILLLRVP